jgi:hypothetical protein
MEITKGRKKEKKSETRQNYCQVAWSNVFFSLVSAFVCVGTVLLHNGRHILYLSEWCETTRRKGPGKENRIGNGGDWKNPEKVK